ncbi:unnamed protein product [Prorocentrum cordatum]|uniref:Beta-galactosidase n=1 Tax=Prorocentrum cordatum TaxID=2364126 RepID=A0ABN9TSS8_9DINO|nr:unnamed protein product [Polarella glacialis]
MRHCGAALAHPRAAAGPTPLPAIRSAAPPAPAQRCGGLLREGGRRPADAELLAAGAGLALGAGLCQRARPAARARLGRARAAAQAAGAPRRLEMRGDAFWLDGQRHRILSGSVSYFRMVPEQWRDRLEKLEALGCNAVELYVPWNLHEPKPGEFRFDGRRDLPAFLALCGELGLDVLLRPGPYICAEWDLGGLPWWLLDRQDPVPLRSSDPDYLARVESWWGTLLPLVKPFLAGSGGPVIAVQIENEFGYWGSDGGYLERLRDLLRSAFAPECPLLFTSDGTFFPDLQENGGVEGALRTANFGSDAEQRLGQLRQALPEGPLVNMEFWVGWFDAWGALAGKSYRAAEDVARTLQATLDQGASVNFFVFHGGTSFGLCGAGANINEAGQYSPQVTSYDYGGLLDEAGEVTDKYLRCREVLAGFLGKPQLLQRSFPRAPRLPKSPPLELEASMDLSAALPALSRRLPATLSAVPLPAERIGCGHGCVLYRGQLSPGPGPLRLGPDAVRDFASVMVDGRVQGTVYRNDGADAREFAVPERGGSLDILVEIMNRINFGPGMVSERKGLVGPSSVARGGSFSGPLRAVLGWECIPLPMDEEDLAGLPWGQHGGSRARRGPWARGPRFFRYSLEVQSPADGFLRLEGFRKVSDPQTARQPRACLPALLRRRHAQLVPAPPASYWRASGDRHTSALARGLGIIGKGFVCVNGFNLGRYWDVGPQRSLYLPGPLLRRGRNEVVVFDVDHAGGGTPPELRIVAEAVWTAGALPSGAREALTDAAAGIACLASGLRRSVAVGPLEGRPFLGGASRSLELPSNSAGKRADQDEDSLLTSDSLFTNTDKAGALFPSLGHGGLRSAAEPKSLAAAHGASVASLGVGAAGPMAAVRMFGGIECTEDEPDDDFRPGVVDPAAADESGGRLEVAEAAAQQQAAEPAAQPPEGGAAAAGGEPGAAGAEAEAARAPPGQGGEGDGEGEPSQAERPRQLEGTAAPTAAGGRRVLAWNDQGQVVVHAEQNRVEVRREGRGEPQRFPPFEGLEMAAVSAGCCCLGAGAGSAAPRLVLRPAEAWEKESFAVPLGGPDEAPEAVACGEDFAAALTSKRLLRVYSANGLPMGLASVPGRAVGLAARGQECALWCSPCPPGAASPLARPARRTRPWTSGSSTSAALRSARSGGCR